jgi:raffinose/stachyose/melibiose transport system substrate-binding protein
MSVWSVPRIAAAIALCLAAMSLSGCAKRESGSAADAKKITLEFISWRTEDIERMNRINALFTRKHPDIAIDFQPVSDTEYDVQMRTRFQTGTGADIVFLRSYDTGRGVYESGWLRDLTKIIPDLDKFPPHAVAAWSTEDGVTYAVPSVGVTHGVYYNKAIFGKHGLAEPATWAEFIAACETLKSSGEIVFAQGTMDEWTLYEVLFSGLGANFYGGEKARQDLMAGRARLTDPAFVSAFQAIASLKKYFPKGFEGLDYVSMQQLFGSTKAAMFIGGSWEIGLFEDLGLDANAIGWFPPPLPEAGGKLRYCFQVDAGIGLNKASKHLDAALEYIRWVSGPEFATALMDELPGFFSFTPGEVMPANPLARKMYDASDNADNTVRTLWEKLSARSPSGNELMGFALSGMMAGNYSPMEAAGYVQEGLSSWYPPFRK